MMVPVTMLPSYLPDLCLENVFMRVPLSDLLGSVRVVCSNWSRVVPTELRRRRELVIVRKEDVGMIRKNESVFNRLMTNFDIRREDGSPWVPHRSLDQICFNALPVPGGVLTKTFTTPLITTLPSITHLTLVHGDIPRNKRKLLKQLVRLVNHYGNDLFCLKLYIDIEYREDLVPNFSTLFESVNELESLRHLTLNVSWPDPTLELNLSVLFHLDTFTSNISSSLLVNSYRQHAIGNVRIVDNELKLSLRKMLQLDQQLASKFTQALVSNHLRVRHFDNMRIFSDRFTAISCLTLFIDTMPMTMVARCLSPLTQLAILQILLLRITEEVPQPELQQVPSVRRLTLRAPIRSHLDTERLNLAQLFPNIQAIFFCQMSLICEECEYDFVEIDDSILEPELVRIEQCLHSARQPFRQCAKLRTILFTSVDDDFAPLFPLTTLTRDEFSLVNV